MNPAPEITVNADGENCAIEPYILTAAVDPDVCVAITWVVISVDNPAVDPEDVVFDNQGNTTTGVIFPIPAKYVLSYECLERA